jgi:hypothetical protein
MTKITKMDRQSIGVLACNAPQLAFLDVVNEVYMYIKRWVENPASLRDVKGITRCPVYVPPLIESIPCFRSVRSEFDSVPRFTQ